MGAWILGLVQLVLSLWLKRPNPLAQMAVTAGTATQVAKDNEKAVETTTAELQAAVDAPTNVDAELNAGTF